MPIGASKVGALGGLVPGGSVTFNASGTWDVPPGVKVVSITGKGATGNPGVAGNPGNPGNPGSGGAGGTAGGSVIYNNTGGVNLVQNNFPGVYGGVAYKLTHTGCFNYPNPTAPANFTNIPCQANPTPTGYNNANPGESGQSGTGGTAGNAGCAGNPGQSSSALGNTFPGGAGGNAGVAGNAGNAGTGGQGGFSGTSATANTAGSAGSASNGGGAGGQGAFICGANVAAQGPSLFPSLPNTPAPLRTKASGGSTGGAGAGSVNSGQPGAPVYVASFAIGPSTTGPEGTYSDPATFPLGKFVAVGPVQYPLGTRFRLGGQGNVSAPVRAFPSAPSQATAPPLIPTFTTGGMGKLGPNTGSWALSFSCCRTNAQFCRTSLNNFNPSPLRPDALRAGAGGGRAFGMEITFPCPSTPTRRWVYGGGGGGGGRGNSGNAGGNSPTPSGQVATPVTYNCVPVTPGTPTPITVGTPGGQVVISWNPQ